MSPSERKNKVNGGNSNLLSVKHIYVFSNLNGKCFKQSARAVKVLKECIRLKPDDATIPLLAAKLCMGSLHWVSFAPCLLSKSCTKILI